MAFCIGFWGNLILYTDFMLSVDLCGLSSMATFGEKGSVFLYKFQGCSKSISLFSVERVIKKKTMDEVSTENNSFLPRYQEKQQDKEKEALVKLQGTELVCICNNSSNSCSGSSSVQIL